MKFKTYYCLLLAAAISSNIALAANDTTTATNNNNSASGSTALSGSNVSSQIQSSSTGNGTATGNVSGGNASQQQGYEGTISTGTGSLSPTVNIDSHATSTGPDLSKAVGAASAPNLTTTLTET